MYRDGDVRRQRLGDAVKLLRVSHWGVEPAEEEKEDDEEEDGEEAAAANRTEYAEVAEAMAEVQAELNPGKFPSFWSRIKPADAQPNATDYDEAAEAAAAAVGLKAPPPHVLILHGEGESWRLHATSGELIRWMVGCTSPTCPPTTTTTRHVTSSLRCSASRRTALPASSCGP